MITLLSGDVCGVCTGDCKGGGRPYRVHHEELRSDLYGGLAVICMEGSRLFNLSHSWIGFVGVSTNH